MVFATAAPIKPGCKIPIACFINITDGREGFYAEIIALWHVY
jgi:hypothetical protein